MQFSRHKNGSKLCLASLAILLSACTGHKASPGQVVTTHCDGQEWRVCYQALTKRCGALGYRLINQITDAGSTAGANNNSLVTGSLTRRSVVAQCKGANH